MQILEHPWVTDLSAVSSAPLPADVGQRIAKCAARKRFMTAAYSAVCISHQTLKRNKHLNMFVQKKKLGVDELQKLHDAFSQV